LELNGLLAVQLNNQGSPACSRYRVHHAEQGLAKGNCGRQYQIAAPDSVWRETLLVLLFTPGCMDAPPWPFNDRSMSESDKN
jgi:hypothetical protein